MSSIVTSILSSTVGLLWNKVRDTTAKHLKDSGITNAQIRQAVVRELNDIDTKLSGLSRKDLLSSYSFLEEGVQLLNVSFEKFEQKAVVNEGNDDRGKTSRMPSGGESDILNEALELFQAMEKLQIMSKEFESAMKRFENARKEATHAFFNEALSIQDRIFAAKLRVVSEILECLDNPDTAATSCLLFLEKLHGLPDVREIFSVYLGGGFWSLLNMTERAENVKSVMMINYVLYRFVSKFSSKYCSTLAWPTVQLPDRSFNPIWNLQEISTRESWGEDLIQPFNQLKLNESPLLTPEQSAINSRGEIVSINNVSGDMTVISRTGTTEHSFPTEGKVAKVIIRKISSLACDEENNVYVLVFETTLENVDDHVALYILDEHYTCVKHKTTLNFLPKLGEFRLMVVLMAINKNSNIVIAPYLLAGNYVYICESTGQLKYKFEWIQWEPISAFWFRLGIKDIAISDKNELILAPFHSHNVYLLTEEGKPKLTLKLPAHNIAYNVAFHFITRKIIVLGYLFMESSYYLHCYSETGELENSMFLCKNDRSEVLAVTSHSCGPVAVVERRSITYV